MFTRTKRLQVLGLVAVIVGVLLSSRAAGTQAGLADTRLQAALTKELVEGVLEDAAALYQQVLATAGVSRTTSAQALLHLAACYERLGRPEARETYQRLVDEFPDQADEASSARRRLAALPAASFPSRTIGSLPAAVDFSPDGRQAFYVKAGGSDQRPASTLISRNLATGVERFIADVPAGQLGEVRVSPNGRWVAVTRTSPWNSASRTYREDLFVAAANSGAGAPGIAALAQIEMAAYGPGAFLQWSPDSRWLPYLKTTATRGRFEIYLLDALTRESRSLGIQVDRRPEFRWSVAGDDLGIHVVDTSARVDEVRIVHAVSWQIRTVALPATAGSRTQLAAWTARGDLLILQGMPHDGTSYRIDGEPVLFAVDSWLVSAETGQTSRTCTSPQQNIWDTRWQGRVLDQCLTVTRDGNWQLVWKSDSQRAALRDTRTQVDHALTTGSGDELFPTLSPDGRLMLFVSNRDRRWGLYAARIGETPDPQPALIGQLEGLPDRLDLFWAGQSVIAQGSETSQDIYRVDMNAATGTARGGLQRLTVQNTHSWEPSLSPDGKQIAYWTDYLSGSGVALMLADGAQERVVSRAAVPVTPRSRAHLYWKTPEDILFAWTPSDPAQRQETRWSTVNARTGVTTPMPLPDLESIPNLGFALSGATDLLYLPGFFQRADRQVFHLRSLADGTDRVVATIDEPRSIINNFVVSADGKRIAYTLHIGGNGQYEHDMGFVVAGASDRKTLERNGTFKLPLAWSPDGRYLLYGAGRPRVMNIETGESWRLLDQPSAPEPNSAFDQLLQYPGWGNGASWAPDGSFLVLALQSTHDEHRQWTGVSLEAVTKATAAGRGGER